MRRLWQHARRFWRRWLWGGLMLLCTNAATMAVPELFRRAIDALHAGVPLAELHTVAASLVAVAVAGAFFRTLSRIHILYGGRDVELSLRCAFYAHLTALEPAFFQAHPTGDLMSRATNDLTQVRLMLGPGLLNLVNTFVAYGTAIPLMMRISVKLTLITFAIYPFALWLMRTLGRRLFLRNRAQNQALGELSNMVQENLGAAQLVRAFVVEREQCERFEELNASYYEKNIAVAWTRSYMFRLAIALAGVSTWLTVYFGAQDVTAGRISLGEIVALVEYMALLSGPTFSLGWVLSLWQRGAAAMARIDEILMRPPSIVAGTLAPATLRPALRLSGLTVQYTGAEPVLHDVSLALEEGETLGIVGPIGSGKTTLVRALLRLLDVPPKTVWVGGHDVTELNLATLRHVFGYVPQNPSLFDKTIEDNVAFGRPGSAAEAVLVALNDAAFTLDLASLPQGLKTPVGERGLTLSGGQKQRCAVARALLVDPPILLLDDALSAVDTLTEDRILRGLARVRRGRTTIIVAHRITTVQHADKLVVLDAGRIAEAGTHLQLVARGGLYASMVQQQALDAGRSRGPRRNGQAGAGGPP